MFNLFYGWLLLCLSGSSFLNERMEFAGSNREGQGNMDSSAGKIRN